MLRRTVRKMLALVCATIILTNIGVILPSAATAVKTVYSTDYTVRLGLDAFTEETAFSVSGGETRTFSASNEGTLDGVEFEAVINFGSNTRQNMLFIGNTNWCGFQIITYSLNNIAVYPVSIGTQTWSDSQIITQDTGKGVPQITDTNIKYSFGFAFSNVSADKSTADVTMTITVADSYSYEFTVKDAPVANLKRKLLIYGAGEHEFGFKRAYTKLGLDAFGITGKRDVMGDNSFTTGNGTASLNNYLIYGNMCFKNENQAIYFGGNKSGLKLSLANSSGGESDDLAIRYQHGNDIYDCGRISAADIGLSSFCNQNISATADFMFSDLKPSVGKETVYVSVCINGAKRFYYLINEAYSDDFKQIIYACSYMGSLTLGDPALQTDYTDISLDDFPEFAAVSDSNSVLETSFLTGKYIDSSLDGTQFSVYITPPSGTRVSFGTDDKSDWNGVNLDFYNNYIMLNDDVYQTIPRTAIYADAEGVNFADVRFKLSVTINFIDLDYDLYKDDLLLSIYINDELLNGASYILPNRVNSLGNRVMFYSGAGNIVLEGLADLSLCDLAIPEGEYDHSVNSVIYGKYNDKSSLINTTVTQDITLNAPGTFINLAGTSEWAGIRLVVNSGSIINIVAAAGEFAESSYITAAAAGVTSFLNNQLRIKAEIKQNNSDVIFKLTINKKLCANMTMSGAAQRLGNYVGYYYPSGSIHLGGETETEYYNLAYGPYLFSAKESNLAINFGPMTDWTTTAPGDYYLSSFGVSGTGEGKFTKKISLYYYGDANTDGELDVCDLVTASRYIDGEEPQTKSGYIGADANGDGAVEDFDLHTIRCKILASDRSLALKDNAVTFQKNVMPIGGYNGPSTTAGMTDSIYSTIRDIGINFVNISGLGYGLNAANAEDEKLLLKALEMSGKYSVDMLVTDGNAGGLASNISSRYLSKFNHYKSFKGYYVADEPVTDYYGSASNARLDLIKSASVVMNSFTNLLGFINLLPMNDSDNLTQYSKETAYRAYIDEYVQTCKPKFICFDDYPFNVSEGAGETKEAYFGSLTAVREKALQYNLPFWTYVQAGANFPKTVNAGCINSTLNNSPTEAQALWNLNTALAYGTKGIIYFPLIQPDFFAKTNYGNSTPDYERNGLIGADLSTITKWANYAKKANKQIAGVDEILLYAKSTEILAIGDTARQNTGIYKTVDSNEILSSVSADNGAIIGVFEFRGKTAFYVVNNDTENSQTIALNLSNTHTVTAYSTQCSSALSSRTANSYSVDLIAGGGALIIIN